uniref:Uncharacterized protein n=1 Tax=Lactuca sativa TaxID=4236 RepID=A0A9R1XBQ3_LACSA|nr:hypothetical protein LSAT_V11C500278730 [Lactuca sativa]
MYEPSKGTRKKPNTKPNLDTAANRQIIYLTESKSIKPGRKDLLRNFFSGSIAVAHRRHIEVERLTEIWQVRENFGTDWGYQGFCYFSSNAYQRMELKKLELFSGSIAIAIAIAI